MNYNPAVNVVGILEIRILTITRMNAAGDIRVLSREPLSIIIIINKLPDEDRAKTIFGQHSPGDDCITIVIYYARTVYTADRLPKVTFS